MSGRELPFAAAIGEALDFCLGNDPSVYLMGLGVPDPKGIFGTTLGLQHKYGESRVMDMPTSENGMTGVAIGSALAGMRPVLTHQRIDFALLAIEQMVNQAAKWHYMFGGKTPVPVVFRMIVGRGWGQGPQHSQSLQSWFAHVPGLKVVMPATAYDAKGLFIASVEDNNPVIFLEHRWLHNARGDVPREAYRVPLGVARTAREGADVTIVSTSLMTLEAIRAAELLAEEGVSAEVLDLRTIAPLDRAAIVSSVAKTRRLVVTDTSWVSFGIGGEIIALVAEEGIPLLAPPRRVCLPDVPSPTSPALAATYYPRAHDVARAALITMGIDPLRVPEPEVTSPLDVPDPSFVGPF